VQLKTRHLFAVFFLNPIDEAMKESFMETIRNDPKRPPLLQEEGLETEVVSPDSSTKHHRLAASRNPYRNILQVVLQQCWQAVVGEDITKQNTARIATLFITYSGLLRKNSLLFRLVLLQNTCLSDHFHRQHRQLPRPMATWRAPWPNCRAPSGHHQTCTKEKGMTE
jgi:hypothetical protein